MFCRKTLPLLDMLPFLSISVDPAKGGSLRREDVYRQVQAEIQGLVKTVLLTFLPREMSTHCAGFWLRYLLLSTSFLVDKNSHCIVPVILSSAVHSVDCLDEIRAAFMPSPSQANKPCFLTPSSPQEMSLYREMAWLAS
ncbi:hypothetical protein WJX77_006539 [Trebouxia sp. C0004]